MKTMRICQRSVIALCIVVILLLVPLCPVQYRIDSKRLPGGRVIYPVQARKLPFYRWKEVALNPESLEAARRFISFQVHWYPLLAYDKIQKQFLHLDALPLPRAY